MKLLVAADSKFFKTPDGRYWCKTIYDYSFWERYLRVFENVIVVSRTKEAEYSDVEGFLRVDGPNVIIKQLPFMEGMLSYIQNYYSFTKAVKNAIEDVDCAIIRLPSVSASMVLKYFKIFKKPYAIEVVADPFDAYSNNRIAQYIYSKNLKKAAIQANGASYVTKYYLQKKYPSFIRKYGLSKEKFENYYSTINLLDSYFSEPRNYRDLNDEITIVHTANAINNDMKGHETVLKTVKALREKNIESNVIFIGDGNVRNDYELLAKRMHIDNFVKFTGLLSPEEVREYLLNSDIFVFPTKAEGLPRAIIEAMAVGLPCLSTPVNGIPELLDDEYLFEPLDDEGFTSKILELIENPSQLSKMSKQNIEKAKEYRSDKLSLKRDEFYRELKEIAASKLI